MTDGELLQRYAKNRSEAAFDELVRRHINLVYSAALRQTGGGAQQAEDVVQAVFTDLARKAAALSGHTSLSGWLYTSTRFAAANIRRAEQRRRVREQEAHAMNTLLQPIEPEPDWAQLRPVLDEAMHVLDESDREAVLLRHFERRSYAEIGARLGLSENAARMRVDRSLEKLHAALTKRGVTSTALALAVLLTTNAVRAAPAALASSVARTALAAGAAAGGFSSLLAELLAASKIKLGVALLIAAAGLTLIVATRHGPAQNAKERAVGSAAKAASSAAGISDTNASVTNANTLLSPTLSSASGQVLRLQIVASDSGKPVPNVPIEYRAWIGDKFQGKEFRANRLGRCDVTYSSNVTELELTTRIDDFADTRLLWRPPSGDIIPTNYVLRLDRPVPISGRVVDADGNPVAGAKVGWNHDDNPAELKLPQNHEFTWIEVRTDANGRWRINRIAEDMIWRIYGSASHTNHVRTPLIFVGQHQAIEKQLRDGTHTFQLGRPVTAHGVVSDADGAPVPEAEVFLGHRNSTDSPHARTQGDGTFALTGCPPGKQLLSAEAEGYAVTTVGADLADGSESIRLVLRKGKLLRLRIADESGTPIPKARLSSSTTAPRRVDSTNPVPVQISFTGNADQEGRIVWSNAPDAELSFNVRAPGYTDLTWVKVRPDGEEHTIVLPAAVKVHGAVRDKADGQPIPRFRIMLGWPEENSLDNSTNAHWSTSSDHWLNFANGQYLHTFESPLIVGMANPGYMLRFEAEGYAPAVSRVIGPGEGDVELDVSLRQATATTVTVCKPDGGLAAYADVGLVFPGSRLNLAQGGFSRQGVQTGGALLRTDANGSFELRPDDSVLRVIAASPDGYAESTPAVLAMNSVMQLQPWGALEVSSFSAGKPVVGREYTIDLGGGGYDTLSLDYSISHYTTDDQGRFRVAQLPPGHHQLGSAWKAEYGLLNSEQFHFEIRPGETTTLNLGASNSAVIARFRWPADVQRKPQWHVWAILGTPMPEQPPDFASSEEARKAYFQTREFKAAQQSMRVYPAIVSDDGTLLVDGVSPGTYLMVITVMDLPATNAGPILPLFQGNAKVTVPADQKLPVDAGEIELKPVTPRPN